MMYSETDVPATEGKGQAPLAGAWQSLELGIVFLKLTVFKAGAQEGTFLPYRTLLSHCVWNLLQKLQPWGKRL